MPDRIATHVLPDELIEGLDMLATEIGASRSSPIRRAVVRILLRLNEMVEQSKPADWDAVVRHAQTATRIAAHLRQRPIVLGKASSVSLNISTHVQLRFLLQEHPVPTDVCKALLIIIERELERPLDMTLLNEAERLLFQDALQWTHSRHGIPLTWIGNRIQEATLFSDDFDLLYRPPSIIERIRNLRAPLYPSRAATLRAFDDIVEATHQWWTDYTQGVRHEYEPPESASSNPLFGGFLGTEFLLYAWRQIARERAHLAGTSVMLFLQIHHNEHARWPERLEDAIDEALLVDPISRGVIRYEKLDPPGPGMAYRLWIEDTDAPESPFTWLLDHSDRVLTLTQPRPPLTDLDVYEVTGDRPR